MLGMDFVRVRRLLHNLPFSRQEDYVNIYEQTTEREKALYNITNDSGVVWVKHIDVGNTVFLKR